MAVNTFALISLNEVKKFMGKIGAKADDDNLLEDLINRISILFENTYMNRNMLSREYTEYYDGANGDILFPAEYPITTISGIWDDMEWGWDSTTEVDSDYYRISNSGQSIVFKNTTLLNYRQNIKVIYTAGYTTIPEDIKHACIIEVARSFKNKQEVDITSKTLPDGSVSYSAKSLLPQTLDVLNKYKRISVI